MATPTERRQAEKEVKVDDTAELELCAKYATLFMSPLGQEILADLRAKSGVDKRIFSVENTYDPIRAAIADGQRGTVIYINEKIEKAGRAKK